MASTYSTHLRIELIDNGSQAGTWGTTTNTNLGTLIEDAISGNATISVTASPRALTALNGAVDEARQSILTLTTTLTAAFTVLAPPVTKQYVVYNNTAYTATIGNATVINGTTPTGGTTVAIPAGKTVTMWSDGANIFSSNTALPGATIAASSVTNVPAGNIAATTVQAALNELDVEKVSLAGTDTITGAKTMTGANVLNGTLGANTPAAASVTTLIASGTSTLAAVNSGALAVTGAITANSAAATAPFIASINGGEVMRINSAGNVGIGTSSPSAPLEVNGTATAVRATSAQLWLSRTTASTHYEGICFKTGFARDAFIGRPPNSDDITFGFDAGLVLVEAMRLNSSGNLLVGTTSISAAKLNVVHAGTYGVYIEGAAGASTPVIFFSGATNTGSISTTGSSVSYNTSSDYRLKEDLQPMTGATERVKALKPVNFAWKVDGSRTDGFLAHEAQAVVPECVTGEKDAVDAEDKPDYQGIDQSKLVPLLTAALQEALVKIDSLTARITALEGN